MTTVSVGTRVERVLGRPEHAIPTWKPLTQLAQTRVLITGGSGSLGVALSAACAGEVASVAAADIDTLDVRDRHAVARYLADYRPRLIFHLAGAKHAPDGELDPWAVTETNTVGTRNLLDAAARYGARVVLASTCKACDPETAYGASKLLAERMVLNAGGSVARFYNVVESAGNVFEQWDALEPDEALPVTPCRRFFISVREAVGLLLWTAVLPIGRYAVAPGKARWMVDVASDLYPGRHHVVVAPRRGDRQTEPLLGSSERVERDGWRMRITSPHEAAA